MAATALRIIHELPAFVFRGRQATFYSQGATSLPSAAMFVCDTPTYWLAAESNTRQSENSFRYK
jgi:hypothetical protein